MEVPAELERSIPPVLNNCKGVKVEPGILVMPKVLPFTFILHSIPVPVFCIPMALFQIPLPLTTKPAPGVVVPIPTKVPSSNIFELPSVTPSGVHLGTVFNVPVPLTMPACAAVTHLWFALFRKSVGDYGNPSSIDRFNIHHGRF